MKKIINRISSFVLALTLCSTVTYAKQPVSTNIDTTSKYTYNEIVSIDGNEVAYNHYVQGASRFTEIIENGVTHITEYNTETGIFKLDGMVIGQSESTPISENAERGRASLRFKKNWKQYDKTTGSISNVAGNVSIVAGVIANATGHPVALCIEIASSAISIGVSKITFTSYHYYIDPVTTARPIVTIKTDFFNGKKRFATVDGRY